MHWPYITGMITSSKLVHVASVNRFVSNLISPATTKLCSMTDHQALILPFKYDDVFTSGLYNKYL